MSSTSDKVRMIRVRLSDAEWKAAKHAALNCEQSLSQFIADAIKAQAERATARETQSRGE